MPISCWVCSVASVTSDSLWPHGLEPTRLLCPWGSTGKNTGVGYHAFLQRIFPIQEDLHLLHCRQILYHWTLRDASENIFTGRVLCEGLMFLWTVYLAWTWLRRNDSSHGPNSVFFKVGVREWQQINWKKDVRQWVDLKSIQTWDIDKCWKSRKDRGTSQMTQ